MIGVAVRPDRANAAAEFFELFKTAWEPYVPGAASTVLVTDGTALAEAAGAVYILFSADEQPEDTPSARLPAELNRGRRVRTAAGSELPVYTACRVFKTAEQPMLSDLSGRVLAYTGTHSGRKVIRVGYDLFDEVAFLLSTGQPVDHAGTAALDRQIAFLRRCILHAGAPVVEIPPCPPGYPYMVCLTHDVDFVSIRQYGFDRTFAGFAWRALAGSLHRVLAGRFTWRQLFRNYAALLSVPLVHLRLVKDFWTQFDEYCRIEDPDRSTFFLIPFKNRPGENVPNANPGRRAARYDVEDIGAEAAALIEAGWEIGLHGIDAWHDAASGRLEQNRLHSVLGEKTCGTRTHWLCRDARTTGVLDQAGFDYDSSCGYNETIGFREGTSQVFRPLEAGHLLEIPLHIQDVALFYPVFLDLDEESAWNRCESVMEECKRYGGVVTVLWHMRSLAPERQWGGFYERLLARFRAEGAWIGTAHQTEVWFRKRRAVRIHLSNSSEDEQLIHLEGNAGVPVTVRVYHPVAHDDAGGPEYEDMVREPPAEIPAGRCTRAISRPFEKAKAE